MHKDTPFNPLLPYRGIVTRDTFWDKYVLKPIQDRMGGRLRFFACGSAPISEEVYNFCRAALGVHVCGPFPSITCFTNSCCLTNSLFFPVGL